MRKAIRVCRENGIEGVVVIGGDGSFRGARDLSQRGIPCVGLPGTIDNDIACCDYTIGYDTCMNTIMEMVDRIRDTAESHDRCMVVEVMGRRAGYLALNAGIAVGATAILVPEIEFDIQKDVIERMKRTPAARTKSTFCHCGRGRWDQCERVGQGDPGEDRRGVSCLCAGPCAARGSPTARDRVLATQMGNYAVKNLLMKGIGNRVVAIHQDKIVDYDIFEALNMEKHIDPELYQTALEVSI